MRLHFMAKHSRRPALAGLLALTLVAVAGFSLARNAQAALPPAGSRSATISLAAMQQLILVWASGTPAITQLAQQHCTQMRLSTDACARVREDVRAAWLSLMAHDPAAVGRVGMPAHLAARQTILAHLSGALGALTHQSLPALLQATQAVMTRVGTPAWWQQAALVVGKPIPGQRTRLVWATAYQQTTLPPGMTPTGSLYAALPDAYLSWANTGNGASIPAIYQPFYLPTGGAHWTVTVSNPAKTSTVKNILITDVGPWNEDDNWWDPNNTDATLPVHCPVSGTLVAPDAIHNALVAGICPHDGHNDRRLYYYLLYQHGGLPFFPATAYQPSGSFADGSAWPTALPLFCAETAGAAINQDGMTCAGNATGSYNGNQGAWLREALHDGPILNQSSVDLSPAVDAALGWTYPSSGLILIDVAKLP